MTLGRLAWDEFDISSTWRICVRSPEHGCSVDAPLITACGVPLRYIGSSRDDAMRCLPRTMLPRPETWSLRVAALLQLPASVAPHLAICLPCVRGGGPRSGGRVVRTAAHGSVPTLKGEKPLWGPSPAYSMGKVPERCEGG